MIYFSPGDHIIDRYRVLDVKKGGMGVVYLCHDELRDMPVALKTFQLESYKDWNPILRDFVRGEKGDGSVF